MSGHRLALAALAALALSVVAPAVALAQTGRGPRLVVVALPLDEARALVEREGGAVAAGVYPESRDAEVFVIEAGKGAPSDETARPSVLRVAIDRAGVTVGFEALGFTGGAHDALDDVLSGGGISSGDRDVPPLRRDLVAISAPDVSTVETLGVDLSEALVIGATGRTPVLVADLSRRGLLAGGLTRRPGIVTPYDVSATILGRLGVAVPEGFVGRALVAERRADPLATLDGLVSRLDREAPTQVNLSAATTAVMLGACVLAIFGLLLGWGGFVRRVAQGAALAPLGYIGALYAASGRAEIRAVPLVAAFVAGFALPVRRLRDVCGWAFLALAAAIATLQVIAWAAPGGAVAEGLWGNPLVLWRTFGLRNHLAAFLSGGLLAGLGLLRAPRRALAPAVLAGAVVVGAPALGANFVGVLTTVFGGAIAWFAFGERRLRVREIAAAALLASSAFVVALVADAGSPVSHGGRAARDVASGGASALWDVVNRRLSLNGEAIASFPGGAVWTALMALGLIAMFAWAAGRLPRRAAGVLGAPDAPWRAGISGAAAAGLAALALEDTGLFTGTDYAYFAAIASAVWLAPRAGQIREHTLGRIGPLQGRRRVVEPESAD